MRIFEIIPERFFSILSAQKKELYVDALMVLRTAFKTELLIRRPELFSMMLDSLEDSFLSADFSEEAMEIGEEGESQDLSGKVHLLLRKLRDCGWIEIEYEPGSFEEIVTVPDYAVAFMDLLYDFSHERIREYNSYVYASYAALKNAGENPDFQLQALLSAHQNTEKLVDELKSLFNGIKRYYQRLAGQQDINILLREHLDQYKEKLFDQIYYPLKTIDSVPRFKGEILRILNAWSMDREVMDRIVGQGIRRRLFSSEEQGREESYAMLNAVINTYENIEELIAGVDAKHNEYVNASIDRIRYIVNADRSARGNLVDLLKNAGREDILNEMRGKLLLSRHSFLDSQSLYRRIKGERREGEKAKPLERRVESPAAVDGFLTELRRQYSDAKIDRYILSIMGERGELYSEEASIRSPEDFILFLLGTLRGEERRAPFSVEFFQGNVERNGCSLPRLCFREKGRKRADRGEGEGEGEGNAGGAV